MTRFMFACLTTIAVFITPAVDLAQPLSYPIIADGRIFIVAGNTLYALDERTKNILWSQVTQAAFGWVPGAAYEHGKVFVVAASFGVGAAIFAFNERTGHQIWAQSLPGSSSLTSPPTALNGIVYTGGSSSTGTLYAIRASDGRMLWTQLVYDGFESSPVVTADGVYVSYAGPQTYKFNPVTGAMIWQYNGPSSGGGGSTPVLYHGLLYVEDSTINQHNGAILDATTGNVVGFFDAVAPPAFANNTSFVNDGQSLVALNTNTGAVTWTVTLGSGDSFGPPPLVTPSLGVVFETTASGSIVAYNMRNGRAVMSVSLGTGGGPSGMALDQNIMLVPAGTHLIALGG
jgi:outer membrane protein assembly factor BamB